MRPAGTRRGRLVATAPVSGRAFRDFEQLADREINFAPCEFDEADDDPGWRVDRRRSTLPSETPGLPLEDGPYAAARELMYGYQFADPSILRAVYDPTTEFEGRNILLVGRFYGLRFRMGVRIGGVTEDELELHGEPANRFRWHYRTLEGHLERGQMDYELIKWTETGGVEFRIRAYSQRARIENTVIRWGFFLFGRSVQLKFYDRSLARMQSMVSATSSPQRSN